MLIDIADAVVSVLNADGFSEAFTAQRLYRPEFSLKDLTGLRFTVVPRSESIETSTRSTDQFDYEIDVAVQKKLATDTVEEIDDLVSLSELIGDRFRHVTLETAPKAYWVESEIRIPYAPEHLEQCQVFTSVLTLTFRMMRSAA